MGESIIIGKWSEKPQFLRKDTDERQEMKKVKPETLLKISSLTGKILLESGAEIQRAEETICRICQAYSVEEVNAFLIPTERSG